MQIIVTFTNGGCTWASNGWGHDRQAMAKARKAINDGKDRAEVIANLQRAGFDVIEQSTH